MQTLMRTQDVLVWDERNRRIDLWEWPTYTWRRWYADVSSAEEGLRLILGAGWEVTSCAVVRHGFFWLKEARVWTFCKPVTWERDGSEKSYVGRRLTPKVPDFPHEDPDSY